MHEAVRERDWWAIRVLLREAVRHGAPTPMHFVHLGLAGSFHRSRWGVPVVKAELRRPSPGRNLVSVPYSAGLQLMAKLEFLLRVNGLSESFAPVRSGTTRRQMLRLLARNMAAEIAPPASNTGWIGWFKRLEMRATASSTAAISSDKPMKIAASVATDLWLIWSPLAPTDSRR